MLSSEDEEENLAQNPLIDLDEEEMPSEDQHGSSEKKKKRRTTKQLYKDKLQSQEQEQKRQLENAPKAINSMNIQ
jgi:hypothetical protein